MLFTTDLLLAHKAQAAGIDGVIVDWETRGKQLRQKNHKLEINLDTPQDVLRLSSAIKIPVIVRINPLGYTTAREVNCALENGAKKLMLPMASSVAEVKEFLKIVDGRAQTIVQVETPSLVKEIGSFSRLDWDYAYLGLNDLMVASGQGSIWQAVFDGTAESICRHLTGRRFGFGGSTILGGGEPIINALILHELIRLGGSITVMRRTFKDELLDRDLNLEMNALREFIKCSEKRGPQAMHRDHEHLLRVLGLHLYPSVKQILDKPVV